MSEDIYVIASIGFGPRESTIMLTLVTLAKNRKPGFILFESQNEKKHADILLVDADNAEAIIKWNTYLKKFGQNETISSIMITDDPPANNDSDSIIYLKKPITATKLLSLLEETVVKNHGYQVPELFEGKITNIKISNSSENLSGNDKTSANLSALVVDDSLPIRIQMKKALENISCDVEFAETGEDAIKLVNTKDYNIIFLDVILPGIDGYDICKLIKKNPEKSETPVIMLTSNSSPADRIKGKMAGCDTYLIKPVRADIFKEVVYEFLDLD